jgi:hypothetical protein
MSNRAYSIINGNYFVSSLDSYQLVGIQGGLVVGIPQNIYNGNSLVFPINTSKFQYAPIKIGSIYITYDEKKSALAFHSSLDDEPNQNFCFSTDGRIILPLRNPIISIINLRGALVPDITLSQYKWRFSNYSPVIGNSPSMWNDKIKYNMDLSSAEVFFNEGSGELHGGCNRYGCSCHQGTKTTCDSGQTLMYRDTGVFEDKVYCLQTKWNDTNKPGCCVGDSKVLKVGTNKLDYDKCKILHTAQICDRLFNDGEINNFSQNEKVGAWMPFSKDCANNVNTINFCAQQDTLNGVPLLLTNQNCKDWCRNNLTECNKAKTTFCENYPLDSACATWCGAKEIQGSVCREIVRNTCVGDKLELEPTCLRYCANKDGDCDTEIKKYCDSLGETEALKHPICGCFMPQSYYNKFFEQLKSRGVSFSSIPTLPDCYNVQCATSPIKTHNYYLNPVKCPDINQCINQVNIDAGGNIIGDIKIIQENKCGFKLRPQDCGATERIDDKTNTCVKCPDGTVPTPNKLTCVCPEGKVLIDGKCVVPSPEDFTLQLIDYIKTDLPINNEIDKQKIIINAPEIANDVLKNGCNQNLNIAKECSNFIPFICSINGAKEYCKDNSDDTEFCNIDGTSKQINSAYGFLCDKIRKEHKIECKDDEYYDPFDNKCKTCPIGMKLKPDKSGCEPIQCGDNAYLDLQTFTCVDCGEDKIADKINHICIPKDSLERQLREYIRGISTSDYENIDYNSLNIHTEEIANSVLQNGQCKVNLNNAINCVDNLLGKCNNDPKQNVYGFDCGKIYKNEEPKSNNLIFVIVGVVVVLIVLGLVLRKKKT